MNRSKVELRAAIASILTKEVGEKHYLVSLNGHHACGGLTLDPERECIKAADALAEKVAWQVESLEAAGFRVLLPGESEGGKA